MSYSVRIGRAAAAEIGEAYGWYEAERPGLGEKFRAALQLHLTELEQYPMAHMAMYRGVRRLLAKPFPYHIYFRIRGDVVKVLAVIHSSRHPNVGRSRTRQH